MGTSNCFIGTGVSRIKEPAFTDRGYEKIGLQVTKYIMEDKADVVKTIISLSLFKVLLSQKLMNVIIDSHIPCM